ncbi:acyl-CoA--6-aminopenicillanic acid acyl-transferase [Hyunsoonleella sp. SJ7]|uniref:Acyl-CoA--6-aminopenicillanic acid acyl-transferase n=1 Tax=Hyunsoonleella aquatilis TaxID=2762758 RepID=A0A923H6N2_9FLAO|nr:C45 family peptidase [Hyunsoonleella aquatilis]MBC3757216.1 acyl-CoA--6-aminopenicillanic acid acyl-transferase [Hyunsoonleella aquatilis]
MKIVLRKIRFAFLAGMYLSVVSCGVSKSLKDVPEVAQYDASTAERISVNDSTFTSGKNSFAKNKYGAWELYVEGNPYQLGLNTGLLTKELFEFQENAFLSKVNELVPSKFKQWLLRKILAFYNRKMYLHIPEEYKTEIYGLSKYAGDDYDHIADDYLRVLYLHGAHDIGHALQDLALVGCSSFAAWGDKTEDGQLLIGRNFDFYAGDDFAKNKIIAFVNPAKGHKFMSVTWSGMIGVVSGMNEHGLTVTINAGKSKIPWIAKTPISILNREILQYASNIEEAIAIAKKRQVFVSESIFIGSAKDKRAVIIEVSPKNFGVYEVESSNELICSNHFQSEAYAEDENNILHKKESHSVYRYQRMEELLDDAKKMNVEKAIAVLRNREGIDDKSLGYGNEKALNQLRAHHGIVFKPEERQVWVSSNPYQLGAFLAYDLDEVFSGKLPKWGLLNQKLIVEEDEFLYSRAYKDYETYRKLNRDMQEAIKTDKTVLPETIDTFKKSNPNFWETYYQIGKYYYEKGYYRAALIAFEEAKTKEVTTVPDLRTLDDYIKTLKRKLD